MKEVGDTNLLVAVLHVRNDAQRSVRNTPQAI
jgi:hypothetical protein